jgi:large subunit ribosomal protein L22
MKTYARLRYLGVAPLKVRRFAGTIKGESVDRALAILDLQASPACQALHKLLRSAVANAQNNNNLAPEYLYVSDVLVDQGPTMKRIRPRARGRAYRILKRSSHVTIELNLKPGLSLERLEAEREEAAKAKRRGRKQSEPAETEAGAEAKAEKKPSKKAGKDAPPKQAGKRSGKARSKAEAPAAAGEESAAALKAQAGAKPKAKPRAKTTKTKPAEKKSKEE